MMDQASLSSPSPTSPFFFHHSNSRYDEDDGMQMISGSSTSSTSTMPLLTETHFSLEEYSPLSLVEDCDNALPISPTSLACGSHHSFKSPLNGLKIDNLSMSDVDVHDARSMSPSMMSSSVSNHHNLWSNSSTAITQNTSLLNSTSTSFLLSQHHQSQLNSFIQQLEPQSLDEAPPIATSSVSCLDTSNSLLHRPSSEPPPGAANADESSQIESKSLHDQATSLNSKQSFGQSEFASSVSSPTSGRSRKTRNKSSGSGARSQLNGKNAKINDKKLSSPSDTQSAAQTTQQLQPIHNSKIHLQLNHHKKLQELQKRLFGVIETPENDTQSATQCNNLEKEPVAISEPSPRSESCKVIVKQEPDSSATQPTGAKCKTTESTNHQNQTLKTRTSAPKSKQNASKNVTPEKAEPDTTTINLQGTSTSSLTGDNQVKPITSGPNEKANEVSLANWSTQQQSCNNGNMNNSSQTIGAHQIAIQVICQDGTSLVLPVSSAAGINAAVSLTLQHHQQLQAVLANQQQQRANSNQMLMSVSNIVAQQQNGDPVTPNLNGANLVVLSSNGSNLTSQQHQQQASGLAASSPTLAALLDAGSTRTTNVGTTGNDSGNNLSSQSFATTSLLKRLVNAGSSPVGELKRSEVSMGQSSSFGFTNCGSMLSTCNANNNSSNLGLAAVDNLSQSLKTSTRSTDSRSSGNLSQGSSEKRVKLESGDTNSGSQERTFSVIQTQHLIVANGNEKSSGDKQNKLEAGSSELMTVLSSGKTTGGVTPGNSSNNNDISPQLTNSNKATASEVSTGASSFTSTSSTSSLTTSPTATSKQSKMGSSTGNRQVDPAQPFRCEHCNSTFTRLGNFTRHKKIHTVPTKDGQRFKCDVCSKSFLQRCDLARHLHIHRGTEPHRCNICGKGYIRHSDLVTHQRFHNKEKPFGCPHCSKGFCQRGDLNRHLRSIHLQMKPILCPCCNRKFAKQETLLRHLNTAHRSKPGVNTTTPHIVAASTADMTSSLTNCQLVDQDEDNQSTVSVVTTNALLLNNNKNNNVTTTQTSTKDAQVGSAQSIKAPT